ncbi:hypothetical protein FHX44_11957 [Pseudonocardia hierapolitana]|uniref:DUF7144 domain-containing protein n=1 Tax=Pseudonocardia hierapolitana TaxID=1128676 RepID=A0A561SJR0_9PSEU|nr:hypothetical protein [Pseudonocardia hierapolitana]TWF75073.1 hypothetical protein FHX44_11957 [Pseudonocardia hierapolitana]
MSTSHQATPGSQADYRDATARSATGASPLASGLALFAGIVMIIAGIFQAVAGLVALFQNELYVVGVTYVFSFDVTAWGWIHLLVGALVAVAGGAVLMGHLWGRVIGIGLASLSMIANFLFVPYYPIWSLLIIALDVAVIWALCSYDREAARR